MVFIEVESERRTEGGDVPPSPEDAGDGNPYLSRVRTGGMGGCRDHGGVPATAEVAGNPRLTWQRVPFTLRGVMLRAKSPEHGAAQGFAGRT